MNKSELYLHICNELDALFLKYNPCGFIEGRCRYSRENNLKEKSCCISNCSQLNDKGCKTKNLMCKLAFGCDILERPEYAELNIQIENLRKLSKQNGLHGCTFFRSTEDALILINHNNIRS